MKSIRQFIKDGFSPKLVVEGDGTVKTAAWYNPRHWSFMDWSNVATIVSVGLYVAARIGDPPKHPLMPPKNGAA